MRYKRNIRVHTKVDAPTFKTLEEKRRAGGFRSIYQMLQAILVCFCRYRNPEYDRAFTDGMRKEIEEMFDELSETGKEQERIYKAHRNKKR